MNSEFESRVSVRPSNDLCEGWTVGERKTLARDIDEKDEHERPWDIERYIHAFQPQLIIENLSGKNLND